MYADPDRPTEPIDDGLPDEQDDDSIGNRTLLAGFSGWFISFTVHGAVAAILAAVVLAAHLEQEPPPTRLTNLVPPPEREEIEPPTERSLEEVEIEIQVEELVDEPVVSELDLELEELQTEDDELAEVEDPKGVDEAIADSAAGGTAAFMAIGANGGAKGAFGSRRDGGKKRAIGDHGGSIRSENAVKGALFWFKRHQSPNGQWDVDAYQDNCGDQPKCEPGQGHTDIQGDVACTAYALLCFLGAGYDHRTPNKYRTVVANGLDWLTQQAQDEQVGVSFGTKGRTYHNAVAAMAVIEAYAMTQDPGIKRLAQGSVDYLLDAQNPDPRQGADSVYRLGWNYSASPNRHDASVSGWAVMALKSAVAGGLDVGSGLEGSKRYLVDAWQDANEHWQTIGSDSKSIFPYTWDPATGETAESYDGGGAPARDGRTTSVGALIAVFLGRTAGDPMLESMLNTIMEHQFPQGYPTNTYYMYYNTFSVFQAGGARWERWNNQVRDMLIQHQRPAADGCFSGSWDWQGTEFHGHETGRLLSTAYNTLCLEVYYRYGLLNP